MLLPPDRSQKIDVFLDPTSMSSEEDSGAAWPTPPQFLTLPSSGSTAYQWASPPNLPRPQWFTERPRRPGILEADSKLLRYMCPPFLHASPTRGFILKFLGDVDRQHSKYGHLCGFDFGGPPSKNLQLSSQIYMAEFFAWALLPSQYFVDLKQVYWCKEPSAPGHEYILLRFDASRPDGGRTLWFRLERDSTSWFRIFGGRNNRNNCTDFLKVRDDLSGVMGSKDIRMASLELGQGSKFIKPIHLALLQGFLQENAPVYDLFTFNCWWYAGCIWEAVALWCRQSGTTTWFELNSTLPGGQSSVEHVTPVPGRRRDPLDWAPTTFAQNLLHAQLSIARRAWPNRKWTDTPVEIVSDDIRHYVTEKVHEDVLQYRRW
ncbi:hypothetical protein JAAARDRAFT_32196 [Jaapia argillacea MUCL 33604]|uniref:Uncharacterized protein n=1 Tax=Jaapia argillacea MUCL 33604 TaxID=933084 RepID=A0A067Q2J3_9AGAM|nr:hypothetical protein JAAARDRAFT_32196 [Jaapia argillacea MUCL 33604]